METVEQGRLADLILLAEAAGLRRKEPESGPWKPGEERCYVVENDGRVLIAELREDGSIDDLVYFLPHKNFRHAGMLMRALEIRLYPIRDKFAIDAGIIAWQAEATGAIDLIVSQAGNTEAAMCAAVCECALEIVKAGVPGKRMI